MLRVCLHVDIALCLFNFMLSVTIVTLPSLSSPLLDLRTIIGNEQLLGGLLEYFEKGVAKGCDHWTSLKWFEEKWLAMF